MKRKALAIALPIIVIVLVIIILVSTNVLKNNIQFDESNFVQWSPTSAVSGMNLVSGNPRPEFICYFPAIVSVGDKNFSSVDLNNIFVQRVAGGFVIKLVSLPSPCECGQVSNALLYLYVDSAGNTRQIKKTLFGAYYAAECVN